MSGFHGAKNLREGPSLGATLQATATICTWYTTIQGRLDSAIQGPAVLNRRAHLHLPQEILPMPGKLPDPTASSLMHLGRDGQPLSTFTFERDILFCMPVLPAS